MLAQKLVFGGQLFYIRGGFVIVQWVKVSFGQSMRGANALENFICDSLLGNC